MALWVANAPGPAPISDVSIEDIEVRDAGKTPARINGLPGSPIQKVALRSIHMPGSEASATTLEEMRITEDTDHDAVKIER